MAPTPTSSRLELAQFNRQKYSCNSNTWDDKATYGDYNFTLYASRKPDRWRRFRGGRSGDGGEDPEGRGVEGGWGRIRIRKGGYTVTHHDYLPIRIASKDVRSLSRNTQQPSGAASVHPAQAQWT